MITSDFFNTIGQKQTYAAELRGWLVVERFSKSDALAALCLFMPIAGWWRKTATLAKNPRASSLRALFCPNVGENVRGRMLSAPHPVAQRRMEMYDSVQRGEVMMSMSKNLKLSICVGGLLAPFLLGSAGADNNNNYSATLSGFEEIGSLPSATASPTGAILSPAQGNLTLNVDKGNQFINFELTYSGFKNNVTQAHIHFGKEHVSGGVMVFFCANPSATPPVVTPPPSPASTPQPCPLNGGTVSGTIMSNDVVGPTAQQVTPGDFNALLAALQSNTAYANIHTVKFPAGEIRGQVQNPSTNK
jgi:hypothetical protein